MISRGAFVWFGLSLSLLASGGCEPAATSSTTRPGASAQPAQPPPCPTACRGADELWERATQAFNDGFLLRAEARADRALALSCGGRAWACPEAPAPGLALRIRIAHSLGDLARARSLLTQLALRPSEQSSVAALTSELDKPLGGDAPPGTSTSPPQPSAGWREEDVRAAVNALTSGRLDEAERLALHPALGPPGEDATNAFVILARVAEQRGQPARARRMYARGYRAWTGAPLRPALPENDEWAAALRYKGFRPVLGVCEPRGGGRSSLTPDGTAIVKVRDDALQLWSVSARIPLERLGRVASEIVCFGEGKTRRVHIALSSADDSNVRALLEDGSWSKVRATIPRIDEAFLFIASDGSTYLPRSGKEDLEHEWFRFLPGHKALDRISMPHRAFLPIPLPRGGLAGTERDGAAVVVDGATGKVQRRYANAFRPGVVEVAVTPDAEWLVARDSSSGFTALNLRSGERKAIERPTKPILGTFEGGVLAVDQEGWAVLHLPEGRIEVTGVINKDRHDLKGSGGATLRLRKSFDGGAFIAIDPEGYFEVRGERSDLLRRAASCDVGYPLELCASALEREGVLERFQKDDLSYREP